MLRLRLVGMFVTIAMLYGLMNVAMRDARGADPATGKLVIVTAEYGDLDSDKTLDVTAKVATMLKDNSLYVEASNAALGTPPGDGPKKLKVGYSIDGIYRSKTVDQGQPLDISTRLIIRKAVYGKIPGGPTADVTDIVSDLVRKNCLTVEASNDLFGDPANNAVKSLRVDYTLDGVAKTMTVEENQKLVIAAPEAKTK